MRTISKPGDPENRHRPAWLTLRFDTWHDVILVEARQGRFRGDVPLNDLEVVSKNDPNYWPVEEYVVWHANRQ